MNRKGLLCTLLVGCMWLNSIPVFAENASENQVSQDEKVEISSDFLEVTAKTWEGKELTAIPQHTQRTGEKIELSINVSGDTEGLRYKFVWMKDDWRQWGVIKDFSPESTTEFQPESAGSYKFYADIMDEQGKTYTSSIDYSVVTGLWVFHQVTTDLKSPQEKYAGPIEISADVTGETSGLQYKFVWAKTDWSKWGVLQDFNSKASVKWMPKEIGEYCLYVDVKDVDGKVITKKLPYTITSVNWQFDSIVFSQDEVKKGENVTVSAEVNGNMQGLSYKFVWMKDNWKEWGVIQDFSEQQEVVWNPSGKAGIYKIYVDIVDRDGRKVTKEKECTVLSQIWKQEDLNINDGVEGRRYTEIPITANAAGETEGLSYKLVWMKDNWKEWGIIKDYDQNNTAVWCPKKIGLYQIYSDVKDEDGQIQTVMKEYTVQEAPWRVESLDVDGSGSYYTGDKTTVTARVSGETEGLQFKFVQKNGNDWSDWKVLRDFDSYNSVEVEIKKEGATTIYVDIMNPGGTICETQSLTLSGQNLLSVKASETNPTLGKGVTFYPQFSGEVSGGEYKYVWMKDNWKEWGVIRDFSENSQITWIPDGLGKYTIYMDARLHGITRTKSVSVVVTRATVNLKVPCLMQYPELPTGCESVALTNTLRYYGYDLAKTKMADEYIPQSNTDFVTAFWGNPHSTKGNCCSAPAIKNAANKYLKEKGSSMYAYDITGSSFQNFYGYLNEGHPVIIWTTINEQPLGACYASQVYNGKVYKTYMNSHTVVLKGYDRNKNIVYISDSISGETTESAEWISFLYGARGMQAVVIY